MSARTPTPPRLQGLDLARGLAVIGMVLVNFMYVFSYDHVQRASVSSPALPDQSFVGMMAATVVFLGFAGRAVSVFLVLFGIGISLQSRSAAARGNVHWRKPLVLRYLLLVFTGALLLPVWEADILHFIGLFGLLALPVARVPPRRLLVGAMLVILVAEALRIRFDYATGWQNGAVGAHYADMRTLAGQARQLWFNGYHPVFPWWSFVLYGLALGSVDFRDRSVLHRMIGLGLIGFVLGVSLQLAGAPAEFFPPHSLFVFLGISNATWVIGGSLWFCQTRSGRLSAWLGSMGRLAFTHYLGHILLGIVPLMLIRSERTDMSFQDSFSLSMIYLVVTLGVGQWWLARHAQGPLEKILRQLSLLPFNRHSLPKTDALDRPTA